MHKLSTVQLDHHLFELFMCQSDFHLCCDDLYGGQKFTCDVKTCGWTFACDVKTCCWTFTCHVKTCAVGGHFLATRRLVLCQG